MLKVLFQGSMPEVVKEMRNFIKMVDLAQEQAGGKPGPPEIRSKEERLEYLRSAHRRIQADKVAAVVPQSGKCEGCGKEFERLRKHAPNCKMRKMWEEEDQQTGALPTGEAQPEWRESLGG